jgi:hypothetical protein
MTNSIQTVDSHKSFDDRKEEPECIIECLIHEVLLNLASTKAAELLHELRSKIIVND